MLCWRHFCIINMATTESQFHTALTALLQGLVKAAVVEICALAETWSADLRMEITMSKSENDDLKRKLQMLEQRLSDRTVGEQDRKSKLPESGNKDDLRVFKCGNKTINLEIAHTDPIGGRLHQHHEDTHQKDDLIQVTCNHALGEIKLEEMEMSVTGKAEDMVHGSERDHQSSELKSESVRIIEPKFQKSECRGGISIDCEEETCDSEQANYQITQNVHLTLPKKEEEDEEAKTDDKQEWVDSLHLSVFCLQQTSTSLLNNSESSSSDHRVILEQNVNVSTSSAAKHSDHSDKTPEPSKKTKKKGPRFICNICGKSLSSKYSLNVHFTLHTGERPHACIQCGKKFVNRTNLQIHQNIHTGEKPYACTLCSKTFADPSACKKHQGMHSRELQQSDRYPKSKFICTVCGKSLSTKQGLRYHLTQHTGQRPFICSWCGKSFVQKHNLKIHQNIHTGAKPYACNFCQKSFADPSSLKKHKRMHM